MSKAWKRMDEEALERMEHVDAVVNNPDDASFGYPGGPLLFKNINFVIDLGSRIANHIRARYWYPVRADVICCTHILIRSRRRGKLKAVVLDLINWLDFGSV